MAVWQYTPASNYVGVLDLHERAYKSVSEPQQAIIDLSSSDSPDFSLRRDIKVSERDFKLFLVSVENAREPSERLRAAAEQYKRKYK